ncbi:putative nucleotide-diphospho-sugar transferase [Palleronia caenipelagi]|uniref:Nucleotide-diphospho-sugar transferase domain-containing protein n=1 Tax=Palleronia caenipelagi TaxID=2489174 RepID=A0A547Q557_9RHOB|nr:putative nucleotide-diphospho-sugar transferase [Palleronia caenipelagi]TRD21530.1 hypothetical protein FEV53_08590 [Palleronia caenipelagi]
MSDLTHDAPQDGSALSCGFVYGATGLRYLGRAIQSARSLRAVSPQAVIDLYCDDAARLPGDHPFDRVIRLDRAATHRPKFEALIRSRFERTVYLDSDTVVLAPIDDLFEVLEQFDFAASHIARRNSDHAVALHKRPVPAAFPQINGGVVGIRRSPAVREFLTAVQSEMDATGTKVDQTIFREFLFYGDLRLTILPEEYNFKRIEIAGVWDSDHAAPRVLHESKLHRRAYRGFSSEKALKLAYGTRLWNHLAALRDSDRSLNPRSKTSRSALYRIPRRRQLTLVGRTQERIAYWLNKSRDASGDWIDPDQS